MRATIASPADLGRLIRHVRAEHGLSQRALAELLGTSQRYLYELETGKPKTADERYFAILSKLGIDLIAQTND